LPDELRRQQELRGNTAMRTAFGSSLQAYCRNRNRDGGVIGSKVALFACPASQALATLGQIELEEGLPHPISNGKWAKMAPEATASYLIVDFGESTIDRAIAMTKCAGLKYLYQSSPFESWGGGHG
jgi:hypothetical protein